MNGFLKYFVLFAIMAVGISSAATLSSCTNLSSTGVTYDLNQTVYTNNSACVNITAQNITLDCHGYGLISNTSAIYGVITNSTNTTIKNCSIINFTTGVYLGSASSASSILFNSIQSDQWVNNLNATNTFNNSASGNAFYYQSGVGAWGVSNGSGLTAAAYPGYSTSGFCINQTTFAAFQGLGIGDCHSYVLTPYVAPPVSGVSTYQASLMGLVVLMLIILMLSFTFVLLNGFNLATMLAIVIALVVGFALLPTITALI